MTGEADTQAAGGSLAGAALAGVQSADAKRETRDPFAQFNLADLISATARLRPQSPAFHDRVQSLTYGELAAYVASAGEILSECGLKPGERILITAGAEISGVIAFIAALCGGYEPALAPLDLNPADLAAFANALEVSALVCPSHYGEMSPVETCFLTAASVATIRLVASCGPEAFDGAVDMSPAACRHYAAEHHDNGLARAASSCTAAPRIITLDPRNGLTPVFHRQSTLIAGAIDFSTRTKIGRQTPILCTLPPTTFAGLVGGPFAALLSGAALHLHGPFDARAFLEACDRLQHPHLVVPAEAAPDLTHAGVMHGLAAAVLVSRHGAHETMRMPQRLDAPCPLIDLYAIDEMAAVAEERRDGIAQPPAQEPHVVGIDGTRVVTIARGTKAGAGLALHGAAVTLAG